MSDTSQGPGWWQASDGKWYAPELHPDRLTATTRAPAAQAPVSPPPPAGRGAGRWIAVAAVIAAIAAGTYFVLRDRDSSKSAASFCSTVSTLGGEAAFENAIGNPNRIAEFSKILDRLVQAAPAEIKSDMKTIADAMHSMLKALESAGSDPASQFGAFFAAAFMVDQKKLSEAGDRLGRYAQEKCGISLNSSASFGPPFNSDFSFDFSGFESFFSS